jgi:hypothetical protein
MSTALFVYISIGLGWALSRLLASVHRFSALHPRWTMGTLCIFAIDWLAWPLILIWEEWL